MHDCTSGTHTLSMVLMEQKLSLRLTSALAGAFSWSFVSCFNFILFFDQFEKHIYLVCVMVDLSLQLLQAKWERQNFTKSPLYTTLVTAQKKP